MPPVFVTATGTGLGKTFLTCALVRALRAAGQPVQALKPVASGIDPDAPEGGDTALLLEALGRRLTPDAMDAVSPWRFRAPLAPTMAARREGRSLDVDDVIAFCRRALAAAGPQTWTVIEGVGGVMAPVDDRHTVLDWMAALDPRVVLVAGSYVGTISHTLTALEVLRARGLDPAAVVRERKQDRRRAAAGGNARRPRPARARRRACSARAALEIVPLEHAEA